jgi:hypothetical protein
LSTKQPHQSSKAVEKSEKNDVFMDVSELHITIADGVLVTITEEESRLLFYCIVPFAGKDSARCMAEIRMSTSDFLRVSQKISESTRSFVDNNKDQSTEPRKNPPLSMFV